MKIIKYIFIVVVCFCVFSCSRKEFSFVPEGYNLVWSDEFDYDGEPDKEKWAYSIGGNGWGNGEIQKYTDNRDNSFVKDGVLSIIARNSNGMWTSARLKTQYKESWTYGYIEIRAKLPVGVGTWPALWLMPEFDKYGGWPRSGEIDIMEHVGFDQDIIHTTIHSSDFNHKKNTQIGHSAKVSNVSSKYHVYAVNWTEDYIEWFVDGKSFFRADKTADTVEAWPFNHNFYLIMNIAIGGSWGGLEGIDKNLKQAVMNVDYVRVYQKQG